MNFFAECEAVFRVVVEFLGKYWYIWAGIVLVWIIVRFVKESK